MVTTARGHELGPQLHAGIYVPQASRIYPVAGSYSNCNRPEGGLWTSTINVNCSSAFLDWAQRNMPYHERWFGDCANWWVLEPADHVRLLVIDTDQDLIAAYHRFPGDETLDYAAIRNAGYHGVHVTERGVHARYEYGTYQGVFGTYPLRVACDGWDAESTVWLHWSFDNVRNLGPAPEPCLPEWRLFDEYDLEEVA